MGLTAPRIGPGAIAKCSFQTINASTQASVPLKKLWHHLRSHFWSPKSLNRFVPPQTWAAIISDPDSWCFFADS
jgi:hypothetical protein